MQEGVYAAGSFEVTQRASGSGMFVDIAASTAENGIAALVQGDAVTGQSLYPIAPHSTFITEAITAAHATLPRVDRVILEMQDQTHDGTGAYAARTRVVTGTATAGATLDNLTGAAAVPSSALLLADVLVAATDTAIGNTEIRDRRKWARGAYSQIVRTAGSYTGNGTVVPIDSTNLNPRIECSGAPVRITLSGIASHTTANSFIGLGVNLDGSALDGTTNVSGVFVASAGGIALVHMEYVTTPAAGSHRFAPTWVPGAPTATLYATAASPLRFTVQELSRPNTANNAVTSG